MQFQTIKVENPNGSSIILGEVHNLKTVQQIHQQLLQTLPGIQFGLTYIEVSKPNVVKYSGTDEPLIHLARINACKIGVACVFILFLSNDYSINAMEAIKRVPNYFRNLLFYVQSGRGYRKPERKRPKFNGVGG